MQTVLIASWYKKRKLEMAVKVLESLQIPHFKLGNSIVLSKGSIGPQYKVQMHHNPDWRQERVQNGSLVPPNLLVHPIHHSPEIQIDTTWCQAHDEICFNFESYTQMLPGDFIFLVEFALGISNLQYQTAVIRQIWATFLWHLFRLSDTEAEVQLEELGESLGPYMDMLLIGIDEKLRVAKEAPKIIDAQIWAEGKILEYSHFQTEITLDIGQELLNHLKNLAPHEQISDLGKLMWRCRIYHSWLVQHDGLDRYAVSRDIHCTSPPSFQLFGELLLSWDVGARLFLLTQQDLHLPQIPQSIQTDHPIQKSTLLVDGSGHAWIIDGPERKIFINPRSVQGTLDFQTKEVRIPREGMEDREISAYVMTGIQPCLQELTLRNNILKLSKYSFASADTENLIKQEIFSVECILEMPINPNWSFTMNSFGTERCYLLLNSKNQPHPEAPRTDYHGQILEIESGSQRANVVWTGAVNEKSDACCEGYIWVWYQTCGFVFLSPSPGSLRWLQFKVRGNKIICHDRKWAFKRNLGSNNYWLSRGFDQDYTGWYVQLRFDLAELRLRVKSLKLKLK